MDWVQLVQDVDQRHEFEILCLKVGNLLTSLTNINLT